MCRCRRATGWWPTRNRAPVACPETERTPYWRMQLRIRFGTVMVTLTVRDSTVRPAATRSGSLAWMATLLEPDP